MAGTEPKIVKVRCDACSGGVRNHLVVAEYVDDLADDEMQCYETTTYQICRCQGCDAFRFREESEINGQSVGERVFPERKQTQRPVIAELESLPGVGRVYAETIAAFGVDALILTGAGLRAIVEAICIQQNAKGKDLQERIDALVETRLLAKPQADLLHEERYIGNTALHEIDPPNAKHVSLGLEIIEGLLNTIYVLPKKADELRAARTARQEARK